MLVFNKTPEERQRIQFEHDKQELLEYAKEVMSLTDEETEVFVRNSLKNYGYSDELIRELY